MQEKLQQVENSSIQVKDMVNKIVGTSTVQIDDYISSVKTLFLTNNITDSDLDKIILQIPVYLYYLTTILQDIDIKKGVSAETAKYCENEFLLSAVGTVAEKQAKASNESVKDRVVQLAFKTASQLIQNKMNNAMEILSSAKKVQQRRLEEMRLTKMAGNSVGAF